MDGDSDASSDEVPTAAHPPSKRACAGPATDGAGQQWHTAADDLDAESEWQARLREESGAELRGGDEDDWERYGGVRTLLDVMHMHDNRKSLAYRSAKSACGLDCLLSSVPDMLHVPVTSCIMQLR